MLSGVALCSGFELNLETDPARPAEAGAPEAEGRRDAALKVEVLQAQRGGTHIDPPRSVVSQELPLVHHGTHLELGAPRLLRWNDVTPPSVVPEHDAEPLGHLCAEEFTVRLSESIEGGTPRLLVELSVGYAQTGLRILAVAGSGWTVTRETNRARAAGMGLSVTYRTLVSHLD